MLVYQSAPRLFDDFGSTDQYIGEYHIGLCDSYHPTQYKRKIFPVLNTAELQCLQQVWMNLKMSLEGNRNGR